ncbi:MAG: bifunctional adenosylcobinamide kinase/adenosylcobinamide-phosphate guanylyltransferase [Pseudomonadota bacterium]
MTAYVHLVLGGARSGKSRLAQGWAESSGMQLVYIATAAAGDGEMASRIARHRQDRDSRWRLAEEEQLLSECIAREQSPDTCLLVDCLTLWLSNCLHAGNWEAQRDALLELLPSVQGRLLFVSNETGLGVVPMGELSRRFVDESGLLHQRLAELCQRVTLVAAGLPLDLKNEAP